MDNKKIYKTYKKGQVIYADFGKKPPGVEGGLRPCVVVSCDESNHSRAPQITVCPLSSKLKKNPVHVVINPLDVSGYHLKTVSDMLPEDIQTISKTAVRGTMGYIRKDSPVMEEINNKLALQLGLQIRANNERREDEHNDKEK